MCSPSCKIVQSKICALNFHTNNNKSYSLICSGGRWELATYLSYKREGCTVSVNSVAGIAAVDPFFRDTGAAKASDASFHLYSIFVSEANAGHRLPRSAKASAAPVVDCRSSRGSVCFWLNCLNMFRCKKTVMPKRSLAECERLISAYNRLKTDLRSTIDVETINNYNVCTVQHASTCKI